MLSDCCLSFLSVSLKLFFTSLLLETLLYPPALRGIERVKQASLLGVDVTDTFSTAAYVDRLHLQVNQRVYLLALLQSSGLQRSSLHLLFNALVSRNVGQCPAPPPLPKKKGAQPQFLAHVYCGQTVAHLSYC